ncbi:hypothetical protein [Emcibacter sp. SYSU 3D8]|uniref:hypothetical protein n=1 Tax=Emcibacter sp. SYSU 3D8 TaxID=3133969 RepID=UPI0031FE7579
MITVWSRKTSQNVFKVMWLPRFLRPSPPDNQLQKRPAYREHVMVSFEELRGRLAY